LQCRKSAVSVIINMPLQCRQSAISVVVNMPLQVSSQT
jgi:hypothetical protein